MAKLDFSNVEEFVPVPAGKYLAEVTASAEGLADSSGKGKWSLTLDVVEDPQHEEEFAGKIIKWDMSLQAQALWKVRQTLIALGEEISKEDEDFNFDASSYVGRRAVMIVGVQKSQEYGERTRVVRLEHASSFVPVAA